MKPASYEKVTGGYVAHNDSGAIVGVLLMIDNESIQKDIKRLRSENRALERGCRYGEVSEEANCG